MLEEYWFSFVMLIAICVLSYYATRFLGSKYNAIHHSKYMKILDRIAIDKDKSIVIVKIGQEQKVLLLSAQVATVVELSKPIEELQVTDESSSISFQSILLQKFTKKGCSDELPMD